MVGSRNRVRYKGKTYHHYGNADDYEDARDTVHISKSDYDEEDSEDRAEMKRIKSHNYLLVPDGYGGYDIYDRKGTGKIIKISIKKFVKANPYYKKRYEEARKDSD